MYLSSLSLNQFRNFKQIDITPNHTFNLIYGNNGNGKTNLLEAIHYLATLKPIRTVPGHHLIQFDTQLATIKAVINRHQESYDIDLILSPRKRKILLNQSPEPQLNRYLFLMRTILFTPDHLMILKGEPGLRRRYFDQGVFYTELTYFERLKQYQIILKNRNVLLKKGREDQHYLHQNKLLLETLNYQFAQLSCHIYQQRIRFLEQFTPLFQETITALSNGALKADLIYTTTADYSEPEQYQKKLETQLNRELDRKRTLIGPHLDDYQFLINGKILKFFGSQGEIRLYLLALKIAQIRHLHQLTGDYPILLLDDFSSELDPQRGGLLFQFLKEIQGQVFITTTDQQKHHLLAGCDFSRFKVIAGAIYQE